jgi:hypothetical protein
MKAVLPLIVLSLAGISLQNASGASAVAWDGHSHMVSSYGGSLQQVERLVLDRCRRRYGPYVKILDATDIVGFGAIAVAHLDNRWIIGVSLGRRSASESETLAKKKCLRAGGVNPRIKWGWYG